jgi:SnoaL-like domain
MFLSNESRVARRIIIIVMLNASTRRVSLDELIDRAEIADLHARYTYHHDVIAPRFVTGQVDASEFDLFDEIFTEDAVLDFTASGGIRGDLETMKEWLPGGYSAFPVQHHLTGQMQITFSEDRTEAHARTWLVNPMGRKLDDGGIELSCSGGWYVDQLVKTDRGWRIRERVYEQLWATHQVVDG